MERYKNPNWTTQFENLPEGWEIDPAIFEEVLQKRIFHCEGANCPIKGKALAKGEGMLRFFKVTGTRALMQEGGITPQRDKKSGAPLFERKDLKRAVLCDHHVRLEETVWDKKKTLSDDSRNRGDKLEIFVSTLFQNLAYLRKEIAKKKRTEKVAKFFLSLTKGAGIEAGVELECIHPLDPTIPKNEVHNYLVRGGEVIGLVFHEDLDSYHGVRVRNKADFISANLFLYSDSMAWVEERLLEWRKTVDERIATKQAREAATAERLAAAQTLKQEEVEAVERSAAELLAFFVDAATPATEDGRRAVGKKPKQRRSVPSPAAARQISEQLDAGGRVKPSFDDIPDVIVDDHAGSSKPTHAVALGDRPEVSQALAAVRVAIDSK